MRGLKKVCKGVRLRVSKHSMSAPWERRVWARVKETFALRARCRGVLWCGYDCSNAKYGEPYSPVQVVASGSAPSSRSNCTMLAWSLLAAICDTSGLSID